MVTSLLPHGMCFLWNLPLILLHVISDAFTAVAYLMIVVIMLVATPSTTIVIYKSRWAMVLFVNFIFWCAMTHIFSIVVIWFPIYILEGTIKLTTAVVSMLTALYLLKLIVEKRWAERRERT